MQFYIFILISALIAFLIFFLYMLNKKGSLSLIFSIFSFFTMVFILGVIGLLLSKDFETAMFFQKLKYLGFPILPSLFFLFLYRLKNYSFPNFKLMFFIIGVPILLMFSMYTNDFHGLYYKDITYTIYEGYFILNTVGGPLYYIFGVFTMIMGIVPLYMLYRFKKESYKEYDKFVTASFITMSVSIVLLLLYTLKLTPMGMDLSPIGHVLQAVVFVLAIVFCNIFDLNEVNEEVITRFKDGIIIFDYNCKLIHFNKSAIQIFDWLNYSLIGKNLKTIEEANILTTNEQDFNFMVEKNSKKIYYDVKVSDIQFKNNPTGRVFIITENTKEILLKKHLKYLATYDGLTKIYNQVYTLTKLEEKFSDAKNSKDEFVVIMLDLNNFKKINDRFGHLVGNDVLVLVAQNIYNIFSKYNYIFGRFGGDEFVVAGIPSTSNEAIDLSETLIRNINSLKKEELADENLTLSVGISSHNFTESNENLSYEDLLRKADLAMYEAKKQKEKIVIK